MIRTLRGRLFLSHLSVAVVGVIVVLVVVRLTAPMLFDDSLRPGGPGGVGGVGNRGAGPGLRSTVADAVTTATVWGAVAGVAVALLAAGIVGSRMLRSLAEVGAATTAIAAGDYTRRITRPPEREIAALADDVTTLARAIDQTEARRMRLISEVAHEMRTPLTVIDGYVEGIADGVFGVEELRHVRAESARLRRLSEDLSTLSRGTEGRLDLAPTVTDLAELVRLTVERLRPRFASTEVDLRVELPDDEVRLTVDPDRVAQVVENLVVNALAATERGRVTVSVSGTSGGAEITVADTGIGLDDDSAERVFERFHRGPGGHAGGSGLGLTIGRQLARAHGGDLTVASRGPGQGSTFVFSLARTPPGASPIRP